MTTGRALAPSRPGAKPRAAVPSRRPSAARSRALQSRLEQRDRLYLLATMGLAILLTVMAIGPVQSYTAAADRVDQLAQSRAELQAEVDRLEARRERLQDPEEVELLAREQLNLVRPGEIPYVVVTPAEPELDPMRPPSADHRRGEPWHRRLGEAVRGLLH